MMPLESDALALYQQLFPPGFFDELTRQAGQRWRQGIYSAAVVVWLMMRQRLQPPGTLASAVEPLTQGHPAALLGPCKRVRQGRVSPNTGGYCQARQKLPTLVASQVHQRTIEQFAEQLSQGWPDLPQRVFVIDGSTLQLEHAPELVAAYPPAENPRNPSHWPVLRIVVLHDTYSGMALEPAWGPMYGPQRVSEQELAEQALGQLPQEAVLVADRNFGIFHSAYTLHRQQRQFVVRLTAERARRLGLPLRAGTDQAVVWQPSRWDCRAHPELPAEAAVPGRLLIYALPGSREPLLFLFTNLDLPAHKILPIYQRRWNIETDLRALKQTVHLHRLTAKSKAMMEKELLVAMAAYNLVRAVICLAAQRAQLTPRDLSFSRVLGLVCTSLPELADQRPAAEQDRSFDRLLRYAACCKLPRRSRHRSYPRAVWWSGYRYPSRNGEQQHAPKTK